MIPGPKRHNEIARQAHHLYEARHVYSDIASEGRLLVFFHCSIPPYAQTNCNRANEHYNKRNDQVVLPEEVKRDKSRAPVGKQLGRVNLVIELLFAEVHGFSPLFIYCWRPRTNLRS